MKKSQILAILETVSRIGRGALFLYSAWAKINDPGVFAASVERYQMLPGGLLGIFSLTMPMLELLAGLALLFTKWQREASLLISGMLAMFIVALTQAFVRGLEISCGCFGVPSVGGREEILIALVRDVILIVPSVWLTCRANAWLWPLGRLPRRWRLLGVYGGGLALTTLFLADLAVSGDLSLPSAGTANGETVARRQGLFVSRGAIRPGEWNADFEGVLEKASNGPAGGGERLHTLCTAGKKHFGRSFSPLARGSYATDGFYPRHRDHKFGRCREKGGGLHSWNE